MNATIRPFTIALLAYALLFTESAHATKLRLSQQQQQQQTPAPVERHTPTPQTTAASPEADVATRLTYAHNVYLQDQSPDPAFPLGEGDGYTIFVAHMNSWGHYTLVSSPAQADMVLQYRASMNAEKPYLKLTFADPATLAPLWVVTVPVTFGRHKKVDLFSQSVLAVTTQVQILAGQPVAPDVVVPRHSHILAESLLGLGMLGAVGLAVYFGHRSAENFADKARQDQRDFCIANHIPLNQCLGA